MTWHWNVKLLIYFNNLWCKFLLVFQVRYEILTGIPVMVWHHIVRLFFNFFNVKISRYFKKTSVLLSICDWHFCTPRKTFWLKMVKNKINNEHRGFLGIATVICNCSYLNFPLHCLYATLLCLTGCGEVCKKKRISPFCDHGCNE